MPSSPGLSHSDASVAKRQRILILEPDQSARERLVMEAEGRGLSAIEAGNVSAARAAIGGSPLDAAIIGFETRDANREALDLLDELQQLDPPVPTVVLVPRGSLADRVEMARRGASRRLEYPLSPSAAINAAFAALHEAGGGKPTVLAVDDDPHILEAIRAFLTPHGMRVETVSDPLLFWQRLDETDPDVVILDIDMPQVSGIELCRALRNDERWTTLPILFLTARSDPASIQRVFAAGADDHVGKPISETELVMRLNNRLERVRQVREQAEVDPVTRVATRRKSLELMRRFTKLARRNSKAFSVSVVDVDQFKAINSSYGHSSGDDVLRHIGHLLVRSLRAEDIVGRWGADEFVVGFYGSGKAEAAVRLDSILAACSAHAFRSDDARSFHTSFSAGVAQLPDDGTEVEALIAAAEEAMRQARFGDAQRVRCAGIADSKGIEYADIALIEDDDALVGLLRHGLETAGFRVRSFGDGEAAVAALAGEKPALSARVIILDVDLPTLNGYDVLRQLSRDGITRASKVIMLTARNAEEDVLSALGLGAIDHVNKPFSLPVLIRKVSSAISSGIG